MLIEDESDTDVSGPINESGIDESILEKAQGIEDELDDGVMPNLVENVDSDSNDESTVATVADINWDDHMHDNYVYDGDNLDDYIEESSEPSVECR